MLKKLREREKKKEEDVFKIRLDGRYGHIYNISKLDDNTTTPAASKQRERDCFESYYYERERSRIDFFLYTTLLENLYYKRLTTTNIKKNKRKTKQ